MSILQDIIPRNCLQKLNSRNSIRQHRRACNSINFIKSSDFSAIMENLLPFEKTDRKILVRKESETDYKYGCNPNKRKTDKIVNYGIVNIDKPKGPTSHQVADYVQKILHIDKSG